MLHAVAGFVSREFLNGLERKLEYEQAAMQKMVEESEVAAEKIKKSPAVLDTRYFVKAPLERV